MINQIAESIEEHNVKPSDRIKEINSRAEPEVPLNGAETYTPGSKVQFESNCLVF